MDQKTIDLIETKYKILWRDHRELTKDVINEEIMADPLLAPIMSQFIPNNEPMHYSFGYKPLIDLILEGPGPKSSLKSLGTLQLDSNGNSVFTIDKGNHIFKGMRTFYNPGDLSETQDPKWFGSKKVAFSYAKRYNGGLHAYKVKGQLKLLDFYNVKTIRNVINYFNSIYDRDDKRNPVRQIKIKTGVDIHILSQVDAYMRYNRYEGEIWLTRYAGISSITGEKLKVVPGLYIWGRGYIDRVVAVALCTYCQEFGLDGYISFDIYSPYLSTTDEEIVLCDYYNVVERDINHPLDSHNWSRYIGVKIPENFILEMSFTSKNRGFRLFEWWEDNHMKTEHNKLIRSQTKDPNNFKMMTLNLHFFVSINSLTPKIKTLDKLALLMKNFNIDLLCLQEFAYDNVIQPQLFRQRFQSYHIDITLAAGNLSNVIISKYPLDILEKIDLTTGTKFESKRVATIFRVITDNPLIKPIKFCNTHLEIGLRYISRSGSLRTRDELKDVIKKNSALRIEQLSRIIQSNNKPHILMGDLNFTPEDPEFRYITKSYTTALDYDLTNPFKTITDYIFYTKESKLIDHLKLSQTVNYRYSDHLPVINILG